MEYQSTEISSILGVVDTFIRWRAEKEKGTRHYHSYHPSEFGKCLRSQQYKHYVQLGHIKVEEETHGSQKLRLFEKGHNMQSRWERYFTAADILRGVWQCVNPYCFMFDDNGKLLSLTEDEISRLPQEGKKRKYGKDCQLGAFKPEKCACGSLDFEYHEVSVVSEEMNMKGHADCILDFSRLSAKKFDGVRPSFNIDVLPKRPIVIDMKTIGDYAWKNQVKKYGLHDYYRTQILIYVHVLDCEYGCVIYENKNDSSVAAFKVDRNDEEFEKIKWQAHIMQKMSEHQLLPPPKPESKDDYDCKYCEFATICHKSPIWDDPNFNEKRNKFYKGK